MKIEIKPYPLLHPTPIVLIGVMVNGIANFTTIGDVAVMGLNHPLVVISLNEKHHSTIGIEALGEFSINIPTEKMLEKVDFCGIYSGSKIDKEMLFELHMNENIPYILECPITLLCKVVNRNQIKQRVIYTAEVTKTIVDEEIYVEKKFKLENIKPILYGLDNNYYSIGRTIGEGYKVGSHLINQKK
ncbi:MAG: flavin reductase family protein [Firmicutes bacterium]|nr:flavin reductase family protein [Bacillota bacterium]